MLLSCIMEIVGWKRDTTFYVELKCVWFSATADKQHFFSIP